MKRKNTGVKESFAVVGLSWIFFLSISVKVLAKKMFYAYKRGALFDVKTYSTWEVVMLIILLMVLVLVTIFYIVCALKPLPRIRNTIMDYREKQYHCSEITKLVVVNRMMTKVYLNGKYKFWVSQDYTNYRSFIKWAEKCSIPIEGDTSIRGVNFNFEATQKRVTIITVIVAVIMLAFGIAFPIIMVMNK